MILEKKTIQLADGILMHVDPSSEYVMLEVDGQKDRLIKKVDLWGACFLIADAKTQDKLMPVRQTELTTVVKIHQVKLKKNMREGDLMSVRCETSIPTLIEENLAGNLVKRRERGTILIPKA